MPRPVDTETNTPWPAEWANRKLQAIRKQAIADLRARDTARGVPPSGQVCEAVVDDEGGSTEGGEAHTMAINPAWQAARHNYREARRLFTARWVKFCSEPQALAPFKAECGKPEAAALAAAIGAAADIEATLPDDLPDPAAAPVDTDAEPGPDTPPEAPAAPKPKPKGKPGRKPKAASATN